MAKRMFPDKLPDPKSEPKGFEITYNRSLRGEGDEIKLSDLRALVREAQHRGFSEHAQVELTNYRHLTSGFACKGQVIQIYDAQGEIVNG